MDDSDQDFVDLCSKLQKRVRKKHGEPRQPTKTEHQPSSQASDGDQRRRHNKKDRVTGTEPVCIGAEPLVPTSRGTGYGSGDSASLAVPSTSAGPGAERDMAAKVKVLQRMQQFKRASPQRMVHMEKRLTKTNTVSLPQLQTQESSESFSSGFHPESQDSDKALALQLQQELDQESAEAQTMDLEDRGLFFCQICHKDLSHMTAKGRSHHLNRCLDESEDSAPAPPPPHGIPDCPICGKKFKSQMSRSAHLKRCSSDMGISPAELLQALQREAEEKQNVPTANTLLQTAGTKRKGPSKSGLPTRKKSRNKTDPLDEETLVALALSSSLLEQEREQQRERETETQLQAEMSLCQTSMTPLLKWRPDPVKGCGKKKKGAILHPPPLILVQDAQTALTRLQERVSALLLRDWNPSPPTPTHCISSLPGWTGAAPFWQKSTMLDGSSTCLSDFYVPALREFITPWESAKADAALSTNCNKLESSVQPMSEGTSVTEKKASMQPISFQSAASCSSAPFTKDTRLLPVDSQALRDLIELAEDGMTLTQWSYTASSSDKGNPHKQYADCNLKCVFTPDKQSSLSTNPHLSSFVLEATEEQADLCVSGFLPETTCTHSKDAHSQVRRKIVVPGADEGRGSHQSAGLSRLASDLSSMVNNPQLSDFQIQVDSGDVYFAHSVMVYARCPLLAEMVHKSDFGVQEEGMSAAQRVLLSDVPGKAVFSLLQFLYTSSCSIPASLRPHVLELAYRFDLHELQHLCELHQDEADYTSQDEEVNNQTDQAIMELLCSMWNKNYEGDEGTDTDGVRNEQKILEEDQQSDDFTSGDKEIREEKMNKEELEEIYEFASTQRKREEEKESKEDEEEKVNEEEVDVVMNLEEPKSGFYEKGLKLKSQLEPDASLDRSYSHLFSESYVLYEDEDVPTLPSVSGRSKTRPPRSQQHQSEPSGRTLLQSSASVVDDFSLIPLPSTSNLPFPGLSPGQVDDRTDIAELNECVPSKRESQGPYHICVPPSPNLTQNMKKEPDLIVLSDSSEEIDVVLSSHSTSSHSPCAVQKLQSYTQIKSQQIPRPDKQTFESKFSSLELCHGGTEDCSPEVSWLIPSTPVQPGKNTKTNSTQTKSSMCRTQLFPKDELLLSLAHVRPTEGSVFKVALNSSKRTSNCDVNKNREVFSGPPSQVSHILTYSHSFQASSEQDTPLHLQPYSSTPLHTDLHHPPGHLAASLLLSNPDKNRLTESPEKIELGSFNFSPLSVSSHHCPSSSCQSSSSHSDHERCSKSPSKSQLSTDSVNTETELKRMVGVEVIEIRNESGKDKGLTSEGAQEEAKRECGEPEGAEYSFQQSFVDEPPIAFNDPLGLDTWAGRNSGCFSLRLEDRGGCGKQEHSFGEATSSFSSNCQPPSSSCCIQSLNTCESSPSKAHTTQQPTTIQAHTSPSATSSPHNPTSPTKTEIKTSLLDSKIWDSWEEEEGEALSLSQRPYHSVQTPVSSCNKKRCSLVPVTPMPHYSDMDTPDLKNKLNRFGVRPLPKCQMILKLKEIHQYTHQLVSSDSEDETTTVGLSAHTNPPATGRSVSSTKTVKFKDPRTPAAISAMKHNEEEAEEILSATQGSNTSISASEESERSNPELCLSYSDSDSDCGISASQAANHLQDRLKAVRSFILSDPTLYSQILQYRPLVLSQLQERLKAAGIRLGAAKLVDYLDSQCITVTTAKLGQPRHRQRKRTGKRSKVASRKKGVTALI